MGLFDSIGGALGLKKGKGESINNPYRLQQEGLINQLQARASGFEPSMEEEKTKQNLGRALGGTVSAIRSSPGLNPALQARLASQAGQQAQTDIVQQGTLARLAEKDQATNSLTSALFGISGQEMQRQQAEGQAEGQRMDRFGKVMSGAGTAAVAMSDKNEKANIKDSDGKALDLVDHLKGKLYEYKDSSNGEGVHVGIMAQDLEKSPLGRSMVFEENGAKKVDFAKGFGAVLAALTEINDKVKLIEGKGKK